MLKNDLYSVMNQVNDNKAILMRTWIANHLVGDDGDEIERVLRLAIQEVEVTKNERPELNISPQYHLGRLDGYVEALEDLFRMGCCIKALDDYQSAKMQRPFDYSDQHMVEYTMSLLADNFDWTKSELQSRWPGLLDSK